MVARRFNAGLENVIRNRMRRVATLEVITKETLIVFDPMSFEQRAVFPLKVRHTRTLVSS